MKNRNAQAGFTLMELLVVVAIIGILSSVVLASLNAARIKALDTTIKANLSNTRAQAEIFYSNGITYNDVCITGANNINNMVLESAHKLATTATVGIDTQAFVYGSTGLVAGNSVCHDTPNGWAAIVSLKNPSIPNSGWCVDSTGTSKEATVLTASSVTCGS